MPLGILKGVGVASRKTRYEIALFDVNDVLLARGLLTATLTHGNLVLGTEADLEIEHSGDIGYGVIKEDGIARFLLPWDNLNLNPPGRTLVCGDMLTLTDIKQTPFM